MSVLLQAESIAKSYGDLELFSDISMSIHKDQKVALIAKNGTGKTTLLNILAGIDTPDVGKVTFTNDIRLGYLNQNPIINEQNSVIEEVFNSSNETVKLIKRYEKAIAENHKDEISSLLSEMDRLNAWDYEVRVKQILAQLKITEFDKTIRYLSGGQKKRIALANLLINEPDLLILDEPTNHLDLEMIEWLEEFLQRSNSTLFMVTHDRYFLDRVCNEILEIENKQIYQYKGNYSYFLEKRDERIHNKNSEIEKARSILKKELEWMRRTPQARTTKAKYRVDAYYDLEEKASQKKYRDKVEIKVSSSRLGKKILNIHNLEKSFDDHKLITDFTYLFKPYEKIGIVGNNGSGKSTLLNIIAGQLEADKGKMEIGETVVMAYYKQDGIQFKEEDTVIDIVKEIAEVVTLNNGKRMSASQFLNYFLFPPKMQHSRVSKLSGGEKRRLYLLTVLIQNPNFLLLDEPTNDLDILTLNVLEEYLCDFDGCILLVSHDRFFMDKIVDSIFVFEGEGKIKNYPGNYTQYRQSRKKIVQAPKPKNTSVSKTRKKSSDTTIQAKRKLSFKEKREMEMLEALIEELQNEKSEIEKQLNSGTLNSDELNEKSERFAEVINQLDDRELRWLELSEIEE